MHHMRRVAAPGGVRLCFTFVVSVVLFTACQNGSAGGPVSGTPDNHCYHLPDGGFPGGPLQVQSTSLASCTPDAGALDGGGGTGLVYGATQFNSASFDDDCKYQVGFWSSPIRQGEDVTFYVSVLHSADGTPATGANSRAEVFLNDRHPAPNTNQAPTEGPDGVYAIGPIRFDASGKWTVRYHFYEQCEDLLPDSPHGHAAFFVNVP